MSSVVSTHHEVLSDYRTQGVYKNSQMNKLGRMVNNISGSNGIKVYTNGYGMEISGQGRLPFDDRLSFGIRFDGYNAGFEANVFSGTLQFADGSGDTMGCYTAEETKIVLSSEEEYIYLSHGWDSEEVTIEHSSTFPNSTSTVLNIPLYKCIQDSTAFDPYQQYLLDSIYNVGNIVIGGGSGSKTRQWIVENRPGVDADVMVRQGTWIYNGVALGSTLDVSPWKYVTVTEDGVIVAEVTLDADDLPTSVVAKFKTEAQLEADRLGHTMFLLALVSETDGVVTEINNVWKGGIIQTTEYPPSASSTEYMVLQLQDLDGSGDLYPTFDWTRLH